MINNFSNLIIINNKIIFYVHFFLNFILYLMLYLFNCILKEFNINQAILKLLIYKIL